MRELGGRSSRDESLRPPPRESWEAQRVKRWTGRNGVGQVVELYEVGPWVELVYYEHSGEFRGGIALNPLYAGKLGVALVELLAERSIDGAGP